MGVGDRRSTVSTDAPVDPSPSRRADVIAVALIAMVVCGAMSFWWFNAVGSTPDPQQNAKNHGKLIFVLYDPPTRPVEEVLVRGDGQIFAALAIDPIAVHPDNIRGGANEEAYRYQRPAYGWLGWLASGGNDDAAPYALIALTVLAGGLLAAAGATFLLTRGTDPRWALLLLLSPGVLIDLTWVGPEALGAALMVFGVTRWLPRGGSSADDVDGGGPVDWGAVACFAAAGLCRETLLLIPFTLMVVELVRRHRHRAFAMALSAVPYVVWVLFLRVRIGAWPSGSVGGRLSPIPFSGMVSAMSGWGRADLAVAVLILGLAVAALVVDRTSGLRTLVAANLAFAAILGEAVWHRFPDFSRVLLPLTVLSVLAILVRCFAKAPVEPAVDQDAISGASIGV